jgi:6 kDa early secretory antigenic target
VRPWTVDPPYTSVQARRAATSSVIKYDFGAIGTAQQDIASTAERLVEIQRNVQQLMQELKGSWTGEASETWRSYQQAWDNIFGSINLILAALGGAVGQALANAESAEAANASMWPPSLA